jgi:hypothetical protein
MSTPKSDRGRHRGLLALVLSLAIAMPFAACSKKAEEHPTQPETPTPPVPNSPENVIALIKWSWTQRDTAAYRQVFTDDYRYVFAASDSNPPANGLDRFQELAVGFHLFRTGSLSNPAATSITFDLSSVNVFADDRPGRNPTVHKKVTASLYVVAITPGPDYSLRSDVSFYVTRGDSAAIPTDTGASPDAGRWYVDRWQDDTVCLGNAPVNGDRVLESCLTVGKLKLDYLPPPAPSTARR